MGALSPQPADEPISGINVTPLVDITLVLLIIFMVTAKLTASSAIAFDPPKVSRTSPASGQAVLAVIVGRDGTTQVGGAPAPDDAAFLALAGDARRKDADLRAVIKADAAASHGRVIHVIDLLSRAGIGKVAFAVTPAPPELTAPTDAAPRP